MTRTLEWEGCLNVRDLGGVPLEDGGETAYGVIVRSDEIYRLRDLRTLERHGIARVVDLRHEQEVARSADRTPPIEVVNVELMPFDPARFDQLSERMLTMEPGDYLEWSYLIFLDEYRSGFARAVSAIAQADGPVCVHCVGGRDRTGLVSALLLRLAGASREEAAEDYWLSEDALREDHARWIAEAADERERRIRSVFDVAPREVVVNVLAALEDEHGSVREYLLEAGVPDDELAALRARLRGEA